MKRRLNWKAFVILLAGALLLGAGMHFLHGAQVQRNASVLLGQAKKFEEKEQLEDAAFYLRLYLRRAPSDMDARARYALLRVRLARNAQQVEDAFLGLEKVLRVQPDRHDVRREAVRLAMGLRRHADARSHLDHLLKGKRDDGELELLYGRCLLAEKRFVREKDEDGAVEWLAHAEEHAPKQIEAYLLHAYLLREELKNPGEADQVMDRMVWNAGSAPAYLARSAYRKKYAEGVGADKDVEQARKIAPDDPEVLLAWAQLAREQAEREKQAKQPRADAIEKLLDESRKALQRGIKLHEKDLRFYDRLAQLEKQTKRPAEAIKALRKGLEAVPDAPALLWGLTLLLLETDPTAEVSDLIVRLRKAGVEEPRLDYLIAATLATEGRWRDAVKQLNRARAQLQSWPEVTRQADLLLGQCFAQLGDAEQQYIAFHRAVKADQLSVPACLGFGAALERLGKPEEALEVYQRIVKKAPEARLAVARLLIAGNSNLPTDKQKQGWDSVKEQLKALPASADKVVLGAQMLLAQGKADQVLSLLDEAERDPKIGDCVEIRLARADHWGRQGEKGRKALLALEENTGKFSVADRHRLWRGLADANARAGDPSQAVRLLRRLAKERPNDLGTRIALFDLALVKEDAQAIQDAIDAIQTVEGAEGIFWRYGRACKLILQAKKGDQSGLEDARKLLGIVADRKPGWPRVALCQAEIAALSGASSSIIAAHLQQAFDQGERSPQVLGRLVELRYEEQSYNKASAVLKILLAQGAVPGPLQRVASEVSWQTRDRKQALELARKAVVQDPKDYRNHLWLGLMLGASGQRKDAEDSLREAVRLAETKPDPRIALVQFLARTGKKEQADAEIKEAERKITPDQAQLALAHCHEAVGETEKARALYDMALVQKPEDVAVLRGFATFLVGINELDKAKPLLETLITLNSPTREDFDWARRMLALVLSMEGDYQKSRRALELLGLVDQDRVGVNDLSIEELRARATVLKMSRDRAERRKAVRFLEELAGRQPLTAEDQFLLAQVYESVDDWPQARVRMLTLVTTHGDDPRFLAHFVRSLLRKNEVKDAAAWHPKLVDLQPDAPQTLELKARLLSAQNNGKEAAELVKTQASRAGANLLRWAGLLEGIAQPGPAEEVYRRWVKEAKKPGAELQLAGFFGRQKQLREALALCKEARKTSPPEAVATASLAALSAGKPDADQCEEVGRWLEFEIGKASGNISRNTSLRNCLCALRNLQGRYAEAKEISLGVLKVKKDDPLALNNLAYFTALEGHGEEALKLLDQAQKIVGPLPLLLDTRAVIHITLAAEKIRQKQGKKAVEHAEEAGKVLEDLLVGEPSALTHFHRAQACELKARALLAPGQEEQVTALLKVQADKERKDAKGALKTAVQLGLKDTDLHPLERPAYQQLLKDLLGV